MKSEGKCDYCSGTFSGSTMGKHLQSCPERKKKIEQDKGDRKVYLIKASCEPFWVYFEADSRNTLKDIDSFLRDLWLECCRHMSGFKILTDFYSSHPEDDDKSMEIRLDKVLSVGLKFTHDYDFGTTTSLLLTCIAERKGKVIDINAIARNNLPDFKCKCGKSAKEICSQCVWDGNGFLCKDCAKKHKCGEDMLLPYVNSPRTGMCGYTG